jgi:hypothetical protein
MAESYRCIHCKKVLMLFEGQDRKCPSCGATDGEVLTQKMIGPGSVLHDPWTGRRARKKRR